MTSLGLCNRYLVGDREVSAAEATSASESVREIIHVNDGVIHREWIQQGRVTRRYDLNINGDAIRRLYYQDGRIAKRDYYDSDGNQVSSEWFDVDGFVTKSVHGKSRWWYQSGVPQKFERSSARFVKVENHWVKEQ